MRSFLYDNLTTKDKVHQQAVGYFEAMPKAEKVVKLEDLTPVIELYHHLIGAGKFEDAYVLWRDRLWKVLFYQLSGYNLQNELLLELFSKDNEEIINLKNDSHKSKVFNELANSYSLSGQPAKAVPLFLRTIGFTERNKETRNLAIDLGNLAHMAQIPIGQLSAAVVHLRKSIALFQEVQAEFDEAVEHKELGRVLAYQHNASGRAEEEFQDAYNIDSKQNNLQALSLIFAYRSVSALLKTRVDVTQKSILRYTLEQAHQALEFAEKDAKTFSPVPRDFIRAYWLLGESLVQYKNQNAKIKKSFEIHFYDEHFQTITGTELVQPDNELETAARCLTEALRRCRKANLVDSESDILLAWARLERSRGSKGEMERLKEYLKEAKEIAERAGYRLKLADIHLFCGEVLLKKPGEKLLGITAKEHLHLAKEYAKDVSTFEDLYQSKDKHFYDGITEYEMLKRGMTEQ
ncbi:MAG: hypothetical protein JSW07_10020, partial [bacterium]